MGARNQVGVADKLQGSFIRPGNAGFRQLLRDLACALVTSAACPAQALDQARVLGIHAQAHDVYRLVDIGDGDFHAGQKRQLQRRSCSCGAGAAGDLVVVGQRPEPDTIVGRTLRQPFGRLRTVGYGRVAVEVGIEEDGHDFILGGARRACCRGGYNTVTNGSDCRQ